MRLLVFTQYFWPEDFRINELVNDFCKRGYEVSIITGQPNYPEGKIHTDFIKNKRRYNKFATAHVVRARVPARGNSKISLMFNYISFIILASIKSFFYCRGKKFDHIFVFEPSPITVCLPAIFIKKIFKIPITFWVLDLWPDTLTAVGVIKKNSMLLKPLSKLTKYIYKNCDLILGQSKSFVNEIRHYCSNNENIKFFPNWVEETYVNEFHDNDIIPNSKQAFKIVFAGNIGTAQDFPKIVQSMISLPDSSNAILYVLGDGRKKRWLEKEIESKNISHRIKLVGRHPQSKMPGCFKRADALLVSLKSDYIFDKTIPGKLQSYMISKKPILGSINGEGAKLIKDANCGLVNNDVNQVSLEENIIKLENLNNHEREKMGISGYKYALENFNKEKLITNLIAWMHKI